MSFELTILGCGSATPTSNQNPTAQLLKMRERFFLVDCGEGTQQQLRRVRAKFSRINHIFISHLHGDHYFGLPGLLSSFHLLGRSKDLHVYGPPELEHILQTIFRASNTTLVYPLHFHPTQDKEMQLLMEDDKVEVFSFPLKHSVPVTGFLFREKIRERNVIREKLAEYKIEVCDIQNIKNGKDHQLPDGRIIPNAELTLDPPEVLKYAFCTDTAYRAKLKDYITDVHLLYHESTFLEKDKPRAKKTRHSTALQAAKAALETRSRNLLLGHYSVRYDDFTELLDEAQTIFPGTYLAEEGMKLHVDHSGVKVDAE